MSVYPQAMKSLLAGQDLDGDTAELLLESMLDGALGPTRTAAVLTALAAKGETALEVASFAEALRRHALPLRARGPLLDTCGTGGSGLATLNTSTLSALICAAAGVRVAKHGNRASSGACGSMDVLEHLGIAIDLSPEQGEALLATGPLAFLNARIHHPALGPLGAIRKGLGFRTVFNLLGPLCNPARPDHQIIGVPDARFGPLLVAALRRLGTKRAMIVAGEDGLDEISLAA
ncbi:MAG: anthranilate phosphoribosyltransferase, partial [bacterium]